MPHRLFAIAVSAAAIFVTLLAISVADACTGLTIKAKDGSVVFGRTLEFAADLQSEILILPRGQQYTGSTPSGQAGLQWTTLYGAAGMNAFSLPLLVDGLNEKGLSIGAFYFPSYAKYQEVIAEDSSRTLAPQEFPTYLLTTCATVDEAVQATRSIKVGNVVFQQFGGVPPAHFIVSDAAGKSVVIEYVGGELKIHANPIGIITNSPTFDWHMTNLANYVNLSVTNVPPVDFDGVILRGLGQGSGMLGLPGDFTPPSRFVRAAAFSQSALRVDTAREGVLQVFHLLNQFDIPKGAARGEEDGHQVSDYTLWTSSSDLTNQRYYYHTFQNRRIRMVDLHAADLDAKNPLRISIAGDEQIDDVTLQAR